VTDLQVCQLSHTALVEDAFDLAAVDVEFAAMARWLPSSWSYRHFRDMNVGEGPIRWMLAAAGLGPRRA